ncbi:cytidylyltransferase domain-containing protein [Streptomyces wedmorensis]|uniref:cytidylyltransferase domain-containing protein n=1 Tax=Streptomyces wedmorensis TaxID=43759 RepID=UPI0037B3A84D
MAVIPCRWGVSRFPGNPLAPLGGKPLLWHVHQRCLEAERLDGGVVATDDERIESVCHDLDPTSTQERKPPGQSTCPRVFSWVVGTSGASVGVPPPACGVSGGGSAGSRTSSTPGFRSAESRSSDSVWAPALGIRAADGDQPWGVRNRDDGKTA